MCYARLDYLCFWSVCVVSVFFVFCHMCIYIVCVENIQILQFHEYAIYIFVFPNNLIICHLNFTVMWICTPIV